jgi:hypothetical protein
VGQHVATVSDREREVHVLLDEQHRRSVADREVTHDRQQALDHDRSETEAELIEQQEPWLAGECPREGQHLLLAARQQPRPAVQ